MGLTGDYCVPTGYSGYDDRTSGSSRWSDTSNHYPDVDAAFPSSQMDTPTVNNDQ